MPDSNEILPSLPAGESVAESAFIAATELDSGVEGEEPAPNLESSEGLWSAIRESIRGSHHHDYTVGPIGRSILLLAVPMVLEMLMESTFAVVDIFWVLHIRPNAVAAEAVTTVGLTESMLTLMYAVAIGLSIGATAMVARRIGERNPEGCARASVQAMVLGLIVAAIFAAIGVPVSGRLLKVMGGSPWVVEHGVGFTRVMFAGNSTIVLLFLINAIFRGAGDAAIAMRVLWLANSINIVLGPCLILGLGPFPRLGVTGAAIATTIGRGTGVLYQLYRLWRGDARVAIRRAQLTLKPAVMRTMLRLSGTGTFQALIGTASWIFLVRIISSFGTDAIAGYQIAIRIIVFALLPSWGLANAAATLVGQSLGAGRPERGERAVWLAGFYNMLCLGGVGALFVTFAGPITGVFTRDPCVAPVAAQCLRTICYGFCCSAWGMVITQSFNGAGDTWTPTWINLGCFWLWEIPLAYVLARHAGLGPRGVALAVTIAFSTVAVVSGVIFRRGRWKVRRV